jgi:chromosome segregation ATPase
MQFQSGNHRFRIFVAILFLVTPPIFSMAQIKTTVPRNEVSESSPGEKEETKPRSPVPEKASDQSEVGVSKRTVQEIFRDELLQEVKSSEDRIKKQLEELEVRLMDTLVKMQSNDINDIQKRIGAINERIEELELKLDTMQADVANAKEVISSQYQPLISMRAELSGVQADVDDLKFSRGEIARLASEQASEIRKRFDDIDVKITAIYGSFLKKVDLSGEVASLHFIQKNDESIKLIVERIAILDGFQNENSSEAKRLSGESQETVKRLTLLQESSDAMKDQLLRIDELDIKFSELAVKLDDLDKNKTNLIDSNFEKENVNSDIESVREDIAELQSLSQEAGDTAVAVNEELQRVLERLDTLGSVETEVANVSFLRERLDTLERQLDSSDLSRRIAEIEENFEKLENKLSSSRNEVKKEKSKAKSNN